MNNNIDSFKSSIRPDYEPFANICYICKKIGKKKSKKFNTLYGLKHHLKTNHNREDEICAGVTRTQILQIIRAISHAIELKMLVDIPRYQMTSGEIRK